MAERYTSARLIKFRLKQARTEPLASLSMAKPCSMGFIPVKVLDAQVDWTSAVSSEEDPGGDMRT